MQGSILSDQDLAELKKSGSDDKCQAVQVGVVISHSCDLTHHDPEGEPFAEVLVAEVADSQDGNFTHGKHPRRLHLLMYSHKGDPCVLEFLAWRRLWVDRRELACRVPDEDRFLLEEDIRVLTVWLAQRYIRAALPDDFNSLVQTTFKKRNKLHARISEHVSGLYVEIYPDRELEDGESYSMNLLALVPRGQKEAIDFVQQGVHELVEHFRQAGIDAEATVRAEDEVSYWLVRKMKRFPLEHLSLRSGDQPLPMEFE